MGGNPWEENTLEGPMQEIPMGGGTHKRVLDNLESPGILFLHFPGLFSPGKRFNLLDSGNKVFRIYI